MVNIALVLPAFFASAFLPVEKPYEFRVELECVHESNLRDFTLKANESEFEITDGAKILIPSGSGEVLVNAARDFADYLFVSMKVGSSVSEKTGKSTIEIKIDKSVGERAYRIGC